MASVIQLDDRLAVPLHRFTVEQYHQLGELGVLAPEDGVELLEGLIVEKMYQRPIRGFIVGLLSEIFQQNLPSGWILRCQLPITTERSEPEPDLAILHGSHADFRDRHPTGTHCRLVIEVADTSLEKDRAKAAIYREDGVQEYWIVNVTDKSLERYQFADASPNTSASIIASDSKILLTCGEAEISLALQQIFS